MRAGEQTRTAVLRGRLSFLLNYTSLGAGIHLEVAQLLEDGATAGYSSLLLRWRSWLPWDYHCKGPWTWEGGHELCPHRPAVAQIRLFSEVWSKELPYEQRKTGCIIKNNTNIT